MRTVARDQAEGLRSLMGRNLVRLVAVVGGGPAAGATSVAMNLSAALAQQGKAVLLLDEQSGPRSVSALWGVAPIGTWDDVVAGRLELAAAVGVAGCGVCVLAVAPAASVPASGPQVVFEERMVLIDAAVRGDGALSELACQADETLIVVRPHAASITAAYARLKRLHAIHALQHSRILINGTASDVDARRVLANLAGAATRYLALTVEPGGCVRADPQIAQAEALGLTAVEAFRTSPAAIDFRRIAAELPHWPRHSAATRLPVSV